MKFHSRSKRIFLASLGIIAACAILPLFFWHKSNNAVYRLNREANLRQIATCATEQRLRSGIAIIDINILSRDYPELPTVLRPVSKGKIPSLTDYQVDTTNEYLVKEKPESFMRLTGTPFIECFFDKDKQHFDFKEY